MPPHGSAPILPVDFDSQPGTWPYGHRSLDAPVAWHQNSQVAAELALKTGKY